MGELLNYKSSSNQNNGNELLFTFKKKNKEVQIIEDEEA